MNYKTYLFDFDYTLADSSRGIVKCFRIVLTRHQYLTVTDEAIKRTIGKTLEESFSILTGITDPVQLEAFRQEYRLEADVHMNVNTQLFPDTLSTLKELKKRSARIGIISTKYRFRILSFLEEYQPEDFLDIVVGGEDVKAANNTRRKNTVPITPPRVISSKTLGSVTNIKEGPLPSAASSPPENTKTEGIIIKPARKAIAVSKISICLTDFSRLQSFFI